MDLITRAPTARIIFFFAALCSVGCDKRSRQGGSATTQAPKSESKKSESAVTASSTMTDKPSAGTKTSSVAAICAAGFDEAVQVIERQDVSFRIASCLAAIGSACPALSEAIVRAAKNASAKNHKERAVILYEAIKNRLSADCKPADANASASKLGRACYRNRPDLSSRLIADMDVGTFAFFLVVEEELKSKSLHGDQAKRVLLNLLLSSAMAGEKRNRNKK